MEVTVSSDLPEGLSEAFRMRSHNRSVGVIVRVQTVTVTERGGVLIRLYAVYLHAVLLFLRGHAFAGPPGPVTATSSLTTCSQPARTRPCFSQGMQEECHRQCCGQRLTCSASLQSQDLSRQIVEKYFLTNFLPFCWMKFLLFFCAKAINQQFASSCVVASGLTHNT